MTEDLMDLKIINSLKLDDSSDDIDKSNYRFLSKFNIVLINNLYLNYQLFTNYV